MGCGHGLVREFNQLNREVNTVKHDVNRAERNVNSLKKTADKLDKALGLSESFNLEKFRNDVIKEHNELRSKHGCPELRSDEDLTSKAQKTAESLAKKDKLENSDLKLKGKSISENLSMWNGNEKPGDEIVREWYDQKVNYNWETPSIATNNQAFVQLIWKSSSLIGVGVAKSTKGNWYVVTNYQPAAESTLDEEDLKENVPKEN